MWINPIIGLFLLCGFYSQIGKLFFLNHIKYFLSTGQCLQICIAYQKIFFFTGSFIIQKKEIMIVFFFLVFEANCLFILVGE